MSMIIPLPASQALCCLKQIPIQKPLVHCITNTVVQNFTANVLLAIGAIPAMVIAKEEVADFVTSADALLVNIGTINNQIAPSMLLAAQTAMTNNKLWVFDPVAVGPTLIYRSAIAQQLLAFKPSVVRANAAEILALCGEKSTAKGPDSQDSTDSALNSAKHLAREYQTIVALTGEIDYITDGHTVYSINGGDIGLTRITGAGCALSAMVAACIACGSSTLLATAAACLLMKQAGERADKQQGLGTYRINLLDQLSLIAP